MKRASELSEEIAGDLVFSTIIPVGQGCRAILLRAGEGKKVKRWG
jgi:hypothetical protein